MTEETKAKLRSAGREDLVEAYEITKSGYAGCDRNGTIVDRRIFPNAVPVMENKMMGIPKPKDLTHHGITTEQIAPGVWVAKCLVHTPIKAEVVQKGSTEAEAINKIKKFLD